MNSIVKESLDKIYEQIQKFFYVNQNNSSDTNKDIIDENTIDETNHESDNEMCDEHTTDTANKTEYASDDDVSYNETEYDSDGDIVFKMPGLRIHYYADNNENNFYYDESSNPFDSFNLANWDGDQQVGFRD